MEWSLCRLKADCCKKKIGDLGFRRFLSSPSLAYLAGGGFVQLSKARRISCPGVEPWECVSLPARGQWASCLCIWDHSLPFSCV